MLHIHFYHVSQRLPCRSEYGTYSPTDQGQGGGVAIEDALSLAALLPLGTTINDLKDRLGLYQECRVERANKIQHFTRLVGMDLRDRKEPLDSKSAHSRHLQPYSYLVLSECIYQLQFWARRVGLLFSKVT